jgi:DNA-directed RNA polymerase specialized sigma24 family protein
VILLKYVEGWSNDEVAAALQKPAGAIKSLQHRALERLRSMMVAEEELVYEPVA